MVDDNCWSRDCVMGSTLWAMDALSLSVDRWINRWAASLCCCSLHHTAPSCSQTTDRDGLELCYIIVPNFWGVFLPINQSSVHSVWLSLPRFSLCQGWGAARNLFTASSDSLFHPPLSIVFFFQSSSSPAFLTSLLTQSSHLSLGLPRLLLPWHK